MSLDAWTITTKDVNQTWSDYEYRIEYKGSSAGSFSLEGSSSPIVYQVEYTSLPLFLDDLLGWSQLTTGPNLYRVIPERHPYWKNFFAQNADVEGMGIARMDGKAPLWKKAKVTTTFKGLTYAILPDDEITTELDRYVIWEEGANIEFLTIQGAMVFQQTNRPLVAQPGKRVLDKAVKLHWLQIPADGDDPAKNPLDARITSLLGKVNSTEFLGYKPGCVLFTHPDPQIAPPRLNGDGIYWNETFEFLIRDQGDSSLYSGERIGHQYAYDQVTNRWDKVRNPTGGGYTYESANLNLLFDLTP